MRSVLFILTFLFLQVSFSQNDTIVDFGQSLLNENRLDIAISYYNKHLIVSQNDEQSIHLLLGLAEAYKLQLNYSEASKYYTRAFEEIELSNNTQLKFFYYVKMAEFYRKRTLFKEAAVELKKADIILKSHQIDDVYLSNFYGRKAALFTEYYFIQDSTLYYASKALKLAEKVNDKDGVFYSSLEISGVYEDKKEFQNAIKSLETLIKYSEDNKLIQQQVDAYINYTRILIKDNQLEKALRECLKALEFAKENELFYGEILFTDNIRNIYKKLGNITKAYQYLEIRLDLTDKYYKIEHDNFLFDLEEKYKLSEKENQITINNLEIENKNKALETNKRQLFISFALLLAAIGISVLIAYFLKKEKRSNKRLQRLSQENKFLLSEANHRINNNLQLMVILISDQLKKTPKKRNFQLKSILTKVEAISTLHKHLYKNEDKNKVDVCSYLNDVKTGFFQVFKENNIETNFNIAPVQIPSDYAMYFGLLLTELCINSIKHAFENQEYKEINFELKYTDRIIFKYSDNGTTRMDNIIQPKLIDKICRQLEIEYEINTENGFSFSFVKEIIND
ncbi:sensor histidine kinase [Bizionia arctica]|uniref:histidine kinase n=1 Tax=Bizionia arctica TaxID=1495645 RepID=A0A917LVA5_9FLAO|nr:sensor histidine kinase [Bizionia arctica]GGG60371.1 hypothetical protein GCM10010976_33940 [Bizionia arctica]